MIIRFVMVMKFYEKYPQLKQKSFLSKVLVDTVFSTMSLENQQVPKIRIIKIVDSILKEKERNGVAFFTKNNSISFYLFKNHSRITTAKTRSRFQKIFNSRLFIFINHIYSFTHTDFIKTFRFKKYILVCRFNCDYRFQ